MAFPNFRFKSQAVRETVLFKIKIIPYEGLGHTHSANYWPLIE